MNKLASFRHLGKLSMTTFKILETTDQNNLIINIRGFQLIVLGGRHYIGTKLKSLNKY